MTLTRAIITEMVSAENGWTQKQTSEYVELLLDTMKGALASGEDLLISGFGKFSVKEKRERKGRNPATGDDLMLESRKVITFKCSHKLRDKINGEPR
jgi:integration host factor subunit alpha